MRSSISRLVIAALVATTLSAVTTSAAVDAAPSAPLVTSSGVNNWSCRPSAQHPNAVVLIHGLGGNGPGHWAFVAPLLASQGYCVFHKTYGAPIPLIPVGGLKPVDQSARELGAFIDAILDATNTSKVDLVGHSEGGFQSLYIPKVLNYGAKVDSVVSLAPPTHGTNFAGFVALADFLGIRPLVEFVLRTYGCPACADLITEGAAVKKLVDGPIAVPGVDYTIIASRTDVLVTPTETSFVREPGVTNMYVQDTCPFDPVGHIGMAFELGVFDMITNALDPASAHPVRCSIGLPF